MVAKSKQVYSGLMFASATPVDAAPHVQVNGADLWTPQGDVTIIGALVRAHLNPLPNTALAIAGGSYCYGEISTVARQEEDRATIVSAYMATFPMLTPTVGEHAFFGDRMEICQAMFPEGLGIDLDRWHPLYLNFGYRAFFGAGGLEAAASGIVWYVER